MEHLQIIKQALEANQQGNKLSIKDVHLVYSAIVELERILDRVGKNEEAKREPATLTAVES